MAEAPKAQLAMYDPNRPMIIELSYTPDPKMVSKLIVAIEDGLARGSAVLVRGWQPGLRMGFSIDDIKLYRPTMSQNVTVQGLSRYTTGIVPF
jgi:hypothetical protein